MFWGFLVVMLDAAHHSMSRRTRSEEPHQGLPRRGGTNWNCPMICLRRMQFPSPTGPVWKSFRASRISLAFRGLGWERIECANCPFGTFGIQAHPR